MTSKGLFVFSISLILKHVTCAIIYEDLDYSEKVRVYRGFSTTSHHSWCYQQDTCKQTSSSSAWKDGDCASGKRQSPIDIKTSSISNDADGPLIGLDFSQYYKNYAMKQFYMTNNGHSITLSNFISETGFEPIFNWPGRENGVYKLEQVHFHWGPDDKSGSEHKIDGKAYPIEMHLVHYRSSQSVHGYSNFADAASSTRPDALAVIGVFLTPDNGNLSQSFLHTAVYNLESVPNSGDTTVVICVNLNLNLGEPLETALDAYHYMGSLTTPGCNEVVAWLVLKNVVKITRRDVEAFRRAVKEEGKPLTMNYR